MTRLQQNIEFIKVTYCVVLAWVYAIERSEDYANMTERIHFLVVQDRRLRALAPNDSDAPVIESGKFKMPTKDLRGAEKRIRVMELSPGGRYLLFITSKKVMVWTAKTLLTTTELSLKEKSALCWSWNQEDDSLHMVVRSLKRYVVFNQVILIA